MEFNLEEYINILKEGNLEEASEYRKKNIPKTLYKYFSLNEFCEGNDYKSKINLNDIKINQIEKKEYWLSTYKNLNDPFELKSLFLEEEKIISKGYPLETIKIIKDMILDSILIGCFTTDKSNMPMWAHYSNNHKGFCIEFDIKDPTYFYPVSYENTRISASNIFMNLIYYCEKARLDDINNEEIEMWKQNMEIILHSFCIKDKSWKYENEYRILNIAEKYTKSGKVIKMKDLGIDIKSIYIGIDCAQDYRNKLIEVAKKMDINIYEMYVNEISNEYKLDYKKIEY